MPFDSEFKLAKPQETYFFFPTENLVVFPMGKYLQVKIQLQKTDVKHRCNWNCLESNFSILKSLSELMQSLRKKNMIDLESFHIILVAWSCLLWSLEDRPEESCLLGLYWSPCMLKAEALGKFLPVQHILLSMSQ